MLKNSFCCVANQVHQDLHDLNRVADHIRHHGRQFVDDVDTGIFLLDQTSEFHRVREDAVQGHAFQCSRATFGKCSDVLNNFVDTCGLISNFSVDFKYLSFVHFR